MKHLCINPLKKMRIDRVAGSIGVTPSPDESVACLTLSSSSTSFTAAEEWKLLDKDGVMVLPLQEHAADDPSETEGVCCPASDKPSTVAAFLSKFCEWPKDDHEKKSSLKSSKSVFPSSTVRVRLAAFDMDDTLIMPKKGTVFANRGDANDWKWVSPNVPATLRALSDSGYILVVFTNQAGIGQGSAKGWDNVTAQAVQLKLLSIREVLGREARFMAVVSTGKNRWRKPNTSMWELAEQMIRREVLTAVHQVYGPGVENITPGEAGRGGNARPLSPLQVDCRQSSFYCGDAAGRVQFVTLAGRKKDFSCTDRKFAHNIGIPFYVPEQIFGSVEDVMETEAALRKRLFRSDGNRSAINSEALEKLAVTSVPYTWDGVDPAVLQQWPTTYTGVTLKMHVFPSGATRDVKLDPPLTRRCSPDAAAVLPSPTLRRSDGKQEMVLLVGFPGCGKTTFYNRFFAPLGYVHVNRDTLKTKEKCLAVTREAWAAGRSVVVDNTNPSSAARMEFIKIVAGSDKKSGTPLPIRVFIFQHSLQEAMHWNEVRYQSGILESRVPTVAFFSFRKQFTPYSEDVLLAERVEAVYEVPPVVCFDGLPKEVAAHFYRLY